MAIVNIHKDSGTVVDLGQHYDERFYDNVEVSDEQAAAVKAGRIYQVEGGVLVEKPTAQKLTPAFVRLDADVPFTPLHAHARDQLVWVMQGSVDLVAGKAEQTHTSGEIFTIAAGLEHQLIGKADGTVILTLQV